MKVLVKIFYDRFYRLLVKFRLIRNKIFYVEGKKVFFHRIKDNNLLINISINGFESHENEVIKLIKNYHWDLNEFYDIGSNVGHYSAIVSLYHENTRVIAVEPFPLNVSYIKELKYNNQFSFEIEEKAVDSASGRIKKFYFPVSKNSSKLPGTGTLINTFKGSGGIFNDLPFEEVEVETVSLDDLIGQSSMSALIKIDCEGNEFNILNNSKLLERDNVDFIVEIMINDNDKSDVFKIMKDNGFKGFLITNAGLVREERALTLPKPNRQDRTLWRNHFFTKKPLSEIKNFSKSHYNYWI
jgi:FkbM family methyltransferase